MSKFDGRTYRGGEFRLDGTEYHNCEFSRSTVVYGGGALPKMTKCTFENCQWKLSGAADRTVQFLTAMHRDAAFRPHVEVTLESIRKPKKRPTRGSP